MFALDDFDVALFGFRRRALCLIEIWDSTPLPEALAINAVFASQQHQLCIVCRTCVYIKIAFATRGRRLIDRDTSSTAMPVPSGSRHRSAAGSRVDGDTYACAESSLGGESVCVYVGWLSEYSWLSSLALFSLANADEFVPLRQFFWKQNVYWF